MELDLVEYLIKIIEIKKLNGYENENYLIETVNNKYIFKKYPYSSELESIGGKHINPITVKDKSLVQKLYFLLDFLY